MINLHRLQLQNFKQIGSIEVAFPDKGSTLIEGHNEAGKSSLFEAVFFALYGESLTGMRHAELKRYGAEEMSVALEFSIEGRRFWVERTVKANQKVRLICPTADGTTEEIKNSTACKQRMELELGISATALLNTCFVEQKRLDKLESISKSDRKETVNELLNMDTLNVLEKQFKVTGEDRDRIQEAKKRVEIAEIDAAIPYLAQEVTAAYRSLLCREAQERAAKRADLRIEIGAIRRKQEENEKQIATIQKVLEQGADFERQLKAICEVLPLHIQARQDAEHQHITAVSQVVELETLEQELPLRREEIEQYRHYYAALQTLEGLTAEAQELAAELKDRQDALTAYDALQAEWDEDETKRERGEQIHAQCQRDYDAAQQVWTARQASGQRMDRIRLLIQHLGAGAELLKEVASLAEEQQAIEAQRLKLPEWETRQTQITGVQALVGHGTELVQGQKNRAIERSAKEKQRSEAETLQTEITESESQLLALSEKRENLRQQAEQAYKQRIAIECRDALIAWADAKERSLEAAPDTGQQDDAKQHATAQAQAVEAQDQIAAAKRKQMPGFALLGSGVLGIIAAFLIPFLVPLLALGALLGLSGGFLLMQTRKSLVEANTKAEAAQKEIEKFAIKQEMAAEQATKFSQQRERRIEEEAAKRAVLERLNVPIPQSPAVARQQVGMYPKDSLENVRQAETNTQNAATQVEADHNALAVSLQKDRERLTGFDLPALDEALRNLTSAEQADADEREKIVIEIDALLSALSLQNTDGLAQELAALQTQIAQAQSAIARLPDLERQQKEKQASAQRETQESERIAQALGLDGDLPQQWEHASIAEQEAYRLECEATPDVHIEQKANTTANNLRDAVQELNRIGGRQEERAKRLTAQNRPLLAANVEATTQKQSENQSAQRKFAPVLEALEARELPRTAAALHTHLSIKQQVIDTDTERVAALPQKRASVESCAAALRLKAEEFAKTWRTVLPTGTLPALSEATTQRESLEHEIDSRHRALNIPQRKIERDDLTEQNIALGKDNAGKQQIVNTLSDEITERYRKLGLEEADAAEKIQRDPILNAAQHRSAEEWQTEHRTREDTLKAKQTERKTQADNLNLSSQPLELETERTALTAAQCERDIKDCATRIVNETRRNIVSRVMPLTMQNVRFLLPALTAGRYKDLKWDENDNSLHIYDERAGEHKSKNVFSGGAKDQISLALRLGFALATLPTGKTSRPNWLFLDEPLSSFDRERTLALIDLLTKGILRKNFDQIFLISHSEAFDANLFDHHLKMENGTLAHSTLPTPAVTP